MKVNKLAIFGLLVLSLLFSGCINQQQNIQESSKIGVVVSILPQKQFVERIGGDKVNVTVMVPPGASPHTYEPTPSQMKAVGDAKLYAKVGSGVEFETAWMDKILAANNKMLLVDCSKGIQLMEMAEHHHEGEEHEEMQDGEDHDQDEHGGLDPHIWTSVKNAEVMVENIYAGLILSDPANTQYYLENKNAYLKELEGLDKQLEESFSGLESKKFMVFHPAWGYLANDYGLTQVPVEQEGKEPSAQELVHLIDEAREENIKVVFASPQFNKDTANSIASEIWGTVVMINPLAEDYVSNMQMVASEIKTSLT
ncbi:MAG: zinc ABC transporter substrate-binding protein [Candidatus Altiarchaeales archaeon]|nr:zinc ABC transporter substrate-binding protein [Candidatus Altiarchaeales archaeon]